MEKKKPGTISKIFSTHPMTDDRIKAAQKNIGELLKPMPEYVVTTSAFAEIKDRLNRMENRRKSDSEKGKENRPTLRRHPGDGRIDSADEKDDKKCKDDEDDRPTLKRRDP